MGKKQVSKARPVRAVLLVNVITIWAQVLAVGKTRMFDTVLQGVFRRLHAQNVRFLLSVEHLGYNTFAASGLKVASQIRNCGCEHHMQTTAYAGLSETCE